MVSINRRTPNRLKFATSILELPDMMMFGSIMHVWKKAAIELNGS